MIQLEPLYTTHDIAVYLRMDPSSVSKWIDAGKLLAFRTPGGHRRVRQSDLVTFLRDCGMPVPTEFTANGTVPKASRSTRRK